MMKTIKGRFSSFAKNLREGKFPILATILIAAVVGLAGGYALWGGGDNSTDTERAGAATHQDHESQVDAARSEMSGLRRLTIRPEQRAMMRLRTVPVERRFPDAELRLVGKVTYDETRLGYITAWVPGRIDDLYVDFTGVTVRKGDHMVKLYSPDLYTAQQELLQAKTSLVELQKSNLKSLRDSAQGTIDSARDRLRLWGLTAEQIADIETRGTPEEHVTIYAPSSGLVIHRNAQEGMYVQTGTRIFTIADLSQVWVQLDAYESDLEWLRYGQEVVFQAEAYGGRKFTGRISFIDPVLDRVTRTVKVRVNVPNPDGLFKPEMFVHATVHARIAAGGKVMDPFLAGKWIGPMHPEIVKDAPGTCDVCGMDLVSAEDLGYVSAIRAETEAPLVVPVSATLMTGTRAIVYVELPDMQQPTYEGREVVLGPRAGDDYIVLHGLSEGELVVAEGNFKIDSALQLQAKPSMMSPSGGQAAGGHNHGGSGEKKMEMQADEMKASMLSEAARAQLQVLERIYANIAAAEKSADLEQLRSGFSSLAAAVKETDMALFTGTSHDMWMELSMRLSNDAFEGTSSPDAETAAANVKKLSDTVEMMRKHLGTTPEAITSLGDAP
jgi:Cu(I)/Ag(I) efflux system membrane fusion protein